MSLKLLEKEFRRLSDDQWLQVEAKIRELHEMSQWKRNQYLRGIAELSSKGFNKLSKHFMENALASRDAYLLDRQLGNKSRIGLGGTASRGLFNFIRSVCPISDTEAIQEFRSEVRKISDHYQQERATLRSEIEGRSCEEGLVLFDSLDRLLCGEMSSKLSNLSSYSYADFDDAIRETYRPTFFRNFLDELPYDTFMKIVMSLPDNNPNKIPGYYHNLYRNYMESSKLAAKPRSRERVMKILGNNNYWGAWGVSGKYGYLFACNCIGVMGHEGARLLKLSGQTFRDATDLKISILTRKSEDIREFVEDFFGEFPNG